MNTTFLISGGAGRVATAIPALEKYEKLHPEDNFNIIVYGWESFFWSHPTLQKKTYGAHQKGLFNFIIKNSQVAIPEPYANYSFYNQQCNLIEAFDKCINLTDQHDDLNYNYLFLSEIEKCKVEELLTRFKLEKQKEKIVVFQPFGSSAELVNNKIVDRSNRSLNLDTYLKLVKEISNDAVVIYVGSPHLKPVEDIYSISIEEYQPYMRTLIGVISLCDYYVGICSVGQHIARSFNKSGLIVMGATSENNFSYPNNFEIFRKRTHKPCYMPWRISDVDVEFSDRQNDGIMNFNQYEQEEILTLIKKNFQKNIQLETSLNVKYN